MQPPSKYAISAEGAGDKVNVKVPSPLFVPTGPDVKPHCQNGPVNLTTVVLSVGPHTSVVITRSVDGAGHGSQLPYTKPLNTSGSVINHCLLA